MRKLLLLVATALAGCVYSFSGFFPRELSRTHVAVFGNTSSRQGLQTPATSAMIDRIRKDGRLEIVGEGEAALLVQGTVTGFRKDPEEYDASGKILTYRVTVEAEISFFDVAKQDYYLKPAKYRGWGLYNPSSETEDQGISRALENLSDQSLSALFSAGF